MQGTTGSLPATVNPQQIPLVKPEDEWAQARPEDMGRFPTPATPMAAGAHWGPLSTLDAPGRISGCTTCWTHTRSVIIARSHSDGTCYKQYAAFKAGGEMSYPPLVIAARFTTLGLHPDQAVSRQVMSKILALEGITLSADEMKGMFYVHNSLVLPGEARSANIKATVADGKLLLHKGGPSDVTGGDLYKAMVEHLRACEAHPGVYTREPEKPKEIDWTTRMQARPAAAEEASQGGEGLEKRLRVEGQTTRGHAMMGSHGKFTIFKRGSPLECLKQVWALLPNACVASEPQRIDYTIGTEAKVLKLTKLVITNDMPVTTGTMTKLYTTWTTHLEKEAAVFASLFGEGSFPIRDIGTAVASMNAAMADVVTQLEASQFTDFKGVVVAAEEFFVRKLRRFHDGLLSQYEWQQMQSDSTFLMAIMKLNMLLPAAAPAATPQSKTAGATGDQKESRAANARRVGGSCASYLCRMGTCKDAPPGSACLAKGNKKFAHACACGGQTLLQNCASCNKREVAKAARELLGRNHLNE